MGEVIELAAKRAAMTRAQLTYALELWALSATMRRLGLRWQAANMEGNAAVHLARVTRRAMAAYQSDAFGERCCDHCGAWYCGPAVYCSLPCAIADTA